MGQKIVTIAWDRMDKNNTAFTLIEVLVVTTIIVALSGTSMALFSLYRDDRVLNNQVQMLTTVLELAKNKASAGDTSLCSEQSSAHVDGYTVTIGSSLTLTPGCDTVPTPIQYSIPATITYTPSSQSLFFNESNYQGNTVRFILKNTDTSRCKFVEIYETGLVTNGDTTCP